MRLIDVDALSEWLKKIPIKDLSDGLGLCRVIFEDDFKKAIHDMPEGCIVKTVPTESEFRRIAIQRGYVPAVRCGECIKRGTYRCPLYPGDEIVDFCSYGERRTDD